MVLQYAKSALSGVSSRISSKSYGFESTPSRSHRMSLDPRIASRPYRIGSKDQSYGMSTKIDGGPIAKDDTWSNDDGHTLLEMGDIAVKSKWEVKCEQRASNHIPMSHTVGIPAHFKTAMITGDNAV